MKPIKANILASLPGRKRDSMGGWTVPLSAFAVLACSELRDALATAPWRIWLCANAALRAPDGNEYAYAYRQRFVLLARPWFNDF